MGWVVSATPHPLYPREWPVTLCIGGGVGPRAGLDGGRKISPTPGFDPRTVQPVASCYNQYATPTDCEEEDLPLSLQGTKPTSTWSPITSNTLSRLKQFVLLFWYWHIHQSILVEWHTVAACEHGRLALLWRIWNVSETGSSVRTILVRPEVVFDPAEVGSLWRWSL